MSIHHIRTELFRTTQADFAVLSGTHQSIVARWETGELEPRLSHLERIRRAAKQRKIRWNDRYFFKRNVA